MKTENTPENKARFFALYYGQKVLHVSEGAKVEQIVDSYFLSRFLKTGYLSLRSISSLTDEECMQVLTKQGYGLDFKYDIHFDVSGEEFMMCTQASKHDNYETVNSHTVDYLRSKGILIFWMDLSVEDIINYGWAKV